MHVKGYCTDCCTPEFHQILQVHAGLVSHDPSCAPDFFFFRAKHCCWTLQGPAIKPQAWHRALLNVLGNVSTARISAMPVFVLQGAADARFKLQLCVAMHWLLAYTSQSAYDMQIPRSESRQIFYSVV